MLWVVWATTADNHARFLSCYPPPQKKCEATVGTDSSKLSWTAEDWKNVVWSFSFKPFQFQWFSAQCRIWKPVLFEVMFEVNCILILYNVTWLADCMVRCTGNAFRVIFGKSQWISFFFLFFYAFNIPLSLYFIYLFIFPSRVCSDKCML